MQETRIDKTVKLLSGAYMAWSAERTKKGIPPSHSSQSEWAREMGIPPTTLSSFITGNRLPTVENVDKLALSPHIGLDIYEAVGMSARMPQDPALRRIAKAWPRLSPDARQRVVELCRELAAGEQAQRQQGGEQAA
jgi:hypothetical protein